MDVPAGYEILPDAQDQLLCRLEEKGEVAWTLVGSKTTVSHALEFEQKISWTLSEAESVVINQQVQKQISASLGFNGTGVSLGASITASVGQGFTTGQAATREITINSDTRYDIVVEPQERRQKYLMHFLELHKSMFSRSSWKPLNPPMEFHKVVGFEWRVTKQYSLNAPPFQDGSEPVEYNIDEVGVWCRVQDQNEPVDIPLRTDNEGKLIIPPHFLSSRSSKA